MATFTSADVYTLIGVLEALEHGIPHFERFVANLNRSSTLDQAGGTYALSLVYAGYEVEIVVVPEGFRAVGQAQDGTMGGGVATTPSGVVDIVRRCYADRPELFDVDASTVLAHFHRLLDDLVRVYGEPPKAKADVRVEHLMIKHLRVAIPSFERRLKVTS